jgi:hypothetical protein
MKEPSVKIHSGVRLRLTQLIGVVVAMVALVAESEDFLSAVGAAAALGNGLH